MTVAVVTGGRDYSPELCELEQLVSLAQGRGVTTVRCGGARGVDSIVEGYLRARGLFEVERWDADWKVHRTSAGPKRNRWMLDGHHKTGPRPPASVLFRFEGGKGTDDCTSAAFDRGLPIEWIGAGLEHEPRIANRHAKTPPGPWSYVGRGRPALWDHGEAVTPWRGVANPLGNPFKLDRSRPRAEQADEVLGKYKAWLWARMRERSPQLAMLHHLRPDHYLVCSCWPGRCHAEVIVQAWRWMRDTGRLRE